MEQISNGNPCVRECPNPDELEVTRGTKAPEQEL